MTFGLSETTIEKIKSVFRQHPEIEEVIIYGSRAKGNFREGSDIDFTMKGAYLTSAIRSKVAIQIDELNTPYLFDISIFNQINNRDLEKHIQNYGKTFYKRLD